MARLQIPRHAGRILTLACVLVFLLTSQLCIFCPTVASRTSSVSVLSLQAPGDPIADAGNDLNVTAGDWVHFNGTGSTDDAGVTNYTWNFTYDGEEQILFDARPEFQFSAPGTYVVTLNVSDAEGNFDTDTVTVVVEKNLLMKHWLIILIVALVALLVARFLVFTRKKEFLSPKTVARYGVLTALTAAVTMATFVPFGPTKGYFNAGDSMVFFSALAFGWRTGGICGGFGSAAADILLGSGYFSPITLVAKGSEGAVCGAIGKLGGGRRLAIIIGIVAGGVCMVLSYFFGELLLLNVGLGAALLEAVGNTFQVVVGGTIGALLSYQVRRAYPSLSRD